MATLEQLEAGVKKAYDAGNMDYARILGAELVRARQSPTAGIPDSQFGTQAATPEPGISQQVAGAGEAALTVGSGIAGMVAGTAKALGQQILSGEFSSQEAQRRVNQTANETAQSMTYAPRTQAGQDIIQSVGSLGESIPPFVPGMNQVAAAGRAAAVPARVASEPLRQAVAAGLWQYPDGPH